MAAQPYVGPDDTLAVLNGELFNLPELQRHVRCPGASEIEVLVAGLRAEGPRFLRRIDGQFAAAVRLGSQGPIFLFRDRFGVAPLYYEPRPDGLIAASNLPALRAMDPNGNWHLSSTGLSAILANWAPTGDLTPFVGVRQVPPGHCLELTGQWDSAMVNWAVDPGGSEDGTDRHTEIVDLEALEDRLREAVQVRLRSTTPVACLLSGGIDSTVLGALASEGGARLGVSLYLDGDDVVRDRQRQVAKILGMDLIQHRLTPLETVQLFERYVSTRGVPLVRLGPVGMMALARRARNEGVRAVLSGEGADELFCGYDSYRLIAARGGQFGPVAALPWDAFGPPEFGAERGERWYAAYWRGLIAFSAKAGNRRADILEPVSEMMRPELRAAFEATRATDGAVVTLDTRRAEDLAKLLGSYLLTIQGDHAWMEESIELRPPYLAAPVANWAFGHDPRAFIAVAHGKIPVRMLLDRLALHRPRLAGLGFAKAAFRVDVSFVLQAPDAAANLRRLVAQCPDDLVDVAALLTRYDACAGSRSCSEAESMLFTLAASLACVPQAGLLSLAPPACIREGFVDG